MESSRAVSVRNFIEFRDGLSVSANKFVVSSILGLTAKLRVRKILAVNRRIQRTSIYLHSYCSLRDIFTANVANKMANLDDEKLFKRVDGQTNLLPLTRRGR